MRLFLAKLVLQSQGIGNLKFEEETRDQVGLGNEKSGSSDGKQLYLDGTVRRALRRGRGNAGKSQRKKKKQNA